MFTEAIKKIKRFTRPIYIVERTFGDDELIRGSATMFFVNEDGVALTSRHVAGAFIDGMKLNNDWKEYLKEKKEIVNDSNYENNLKQLNTKYKYEKGKVVERIFFFPNSATKLKSMIFIPHNTYDIALIKFEGYEKIDYQEHAIFKVIENDNIAQGTSVCLLGFPFPEFSNYEIVEKENSVMFSSSIGNMSTPIFPIDGMITRFGVRDNIKVDIETTCPGLLGHSGGPLFDKDGFVIGIQSLTKHIDLNYKNIDKQYLNLGSSIHVDIILQFLREHDIKHYLDKY